MSNNSTPDPLAALVAALLAEADRWERAAMEEAAAADRLDGESPANEVKVAGLRGWRAGRMVSVKALRGIVAQHTGQHPGGGHQTT